MSLVKFGWGNSGKYKLTRKSVGGSTVQGEEEEERYSIETESMSKRTCGMV